MAYKATDRLVGDFGYVREAKCVLRLFCENSKCRHNVDLDLEALIARYGERHGLHEFILACVCSKCGGRFPDLTLQSVPDYERLRRESGEYYAMLDRMRAEGRLR